MTRTILVVPMVLLSFTAWAEPSAETIVIHEDISATPDGSGNLSEVEGKFNLLLRDVVDDEDLVPNQLGVPADQLPNRDAAVAADRAYALNDIVSFGHGASGACAAVDCLFAIGWRTATPIRTDVQPDLADTELMSAIKSYMLSAGMIDAKIASRLVARTYTVESYLNIDPDQSSGRYAHGGTVKCRCVFNYLVDPKTGRVYLEICNDCLLLVTLG